jgi:hypothetical protein
MLNPPRQEHHAHMPDMMGSGGEGFQPIVPIRVHLRRDEEAADADDVTLENDMAIADDDKNMPPPPPPAYGLWRSSVRVDPNLLHWQRADDVARGSAMSSAAHSRSASLSGPAALRGSVVSSTLQHQHQHQQSQPAAPPTLRDLQQLDTSPRPPSYVSEDGVSYITEAAPRNTTNVRDSRAGGGGLSEIHPAWRPGYAMSEIRGGELPLGAGRRV